jgi:hypothetical protein
MTASGRVLGTLVIAVLGLLNFRTSVSADCAWVLWETLTGSSGIEHSILTARSSERDCRSLVRSTAQRRSDLVGNPGPSGKKPNVTVEPDSVVVLQSEAGILSWAYTCLPDTVDLRGPKRK